jgi:hypothetical protein
MIYQNQPENRFRILTISGIALLLGFILIASTAATTLGKPNFDGSTQGTYCKDLWNKIKDLYDKKKAQNGGLSQGDTTDLANYEKSYTTQCAPTYGYFVANPVNQPDAVLDDNALDDSVNPQPKNPNIRGDIINDDLDAKLQ